MPISIEELCRLINPSRTALLLGAGASMPSGAPSGAELARTLWKELAQCQPESEDLTETATLLERKYGRRAVVEVVRKQLGSLKPTGGLLALPRFGWNKIFSTNFDELIEKAYRAHGIGLTVFRSNFDFSAKENASGTRLYKIHGCITQDDAFGDKASMIIGEKDYENFKAYRQALFNKLQSSLMTEDVLIVGQRLADRHLRDLVRDVLDLRSQGIQGKVYVLVYNRDDVRAPLLEDRGARIAFGGIDEFSSRMSEGAPAPTVVIPASPDRAILLPVELMPVTLDVSVQRTMASNIPRMFAGGSASYADIEAQVTFERAQYVQALSQLSDATWKVLVIKGAAGVGKTTFARQLLAGASKAGQLAWEHRDDFPFQHRPWMAVEENLRASGQRGVLFIDECTHHLRQVNVLIEALAKVSDSALRVIVSANSAQWEPRAKSPVFFSKGESIELSRLAESEIQSLLNLVEFNSTVAGMVHVDFRRLSRPDRYISLNRKASADMFVCLKNIFDKESLDSILLAEYDDLHSGVQDLYRHVAALEAVGTRVHRQLVIRMLGLPADQVQTALNNLAGIIDEYDINPRDGIFGWRTRHLVIARRITEYKFSGLEEMASLFFKIVENINPAEQIELQSIRNLCDAEFGIGRLGDPGTRRDLYRSLIKTAPGERIPWHRLIRELLQAGELDEMEYELQRAVDVVKADAPIDRFRVRLLVARANRGGKISEADRVALLRRAYELAMTNLEHHPWDKISYYTLCDVALELLDRGESEHLLNEALAKLRDAADRILDPDMNSRIQQYEQRGRKKR